MQYVYLISLFASTALAGPVGFRYRKICFFIFLLHSGRKERVVAGFVFISNGFEGIFFNDVGSLISITVVFTSKRL